MMVRDALAATTNFVAVAVTPAHGATYQYRSLYTARTGADTATAAAPAWLKLLKRGAVVDGYVAPDVNNAPGAWKRIGGDQPTATGMIYVGLYVASQQAGVTSTAVFDYVSLSPGPQPFLDDGTYTVTPVSAPDLVLNAAGSGRTAGTTVDIAAPTGAPGQKWLFVDRGQGTFSIHPSYDPTLALTVSGGNTANGTKVVLQPDTGAPNQLWTVVLNPNDTFSLLPRSAPDKGLDDFGGNQTPGFPQDIWQYNNTDPHLQWTLTPA